MANTKSQDRTQSYVFVTMQLQHLVDKLVLYHCYKSVMFEPKMGSMVSDWQNRLIENDHQYLFIKI